jgi:epoxyqueuosine reductase
VTRSITEKLKAQAGELGFELAGIALPQAAPGWERFASWLERGYAGEMAYLYLGSEARRDPQRLLPGTRSLVLLALSYRQAAWRPGPPPLHGKVASYAAGKDYHEVLWRKLDRLAEWLSGEVPGTRSRGLVDTGPLLERDFARLAGLGWFGKNTMLINKGLGSFFFLAALLTTAELTPDPPHLGSHCGTCRACLDACPTHAFPEPGVLDSTRCISYLTIELRRPIPNELRKGLGHHVFGCDICQDVCPWNRRAPEGREPLLQPSLGKGGTVELTELLGLSADEFRSRFRRTALWRSRRRGMLRNAALALGNERDQRAVPALLRALEDEEPLVRGAAAWALGQIGGVEAISALQERLEVEKDDGVAGEIRAALGERQPSFTQE